MMIYQNAVDVHLLGKFQMIAELWRSTEAKLDKTKNESTII